MTGPEVTGPDVTARPVTERPVTEPDVTVIAVTYSPGETLEQFLTTLAQATTHSYDVILADNGSTDGAPQLAARTRPEVRLHATGANLGYGRAANAAAALTQAEWLIIANPDVTWAPGSLDALLAAADRWPRAATLGPLIRTSDGDVYPSARELPALGTGIGHALFGWWWPGNPWTARYRRQRSARSEEAVGWLSGACLLVRRAAFMAIDGFDPGYFMYFEDTDLGARLGHAGWLNVYVPAAEVTHIGGHATRHRPESMLAEHHRSAWRYLSRRYSGARWLPLRLALRCGLALRSAVSRAVSARTASREPQRGADSTPPSR
ncbi:MAG: glycosyltransferase family 2 protein [Pseudonocardiales bacterium]|nr:glycosyltransferase family 2 protein [Pseudonocardiales bacterium]